MISTDRLRGLWGIALSIGATCFLAGLLWASSSTGPGLDWVWVVAIFGAAVVAYNLAFFALCSIYVPELAKLVEDDTEVEGDTVSHVVRHAETGDPQLDPYIKTYASARSISAAAIVACIVTSVVVIFF
jgi:hypothetical protein